jgi:hypothetical protein
MFLVLLVDMDMVVIIIIRSIISVLGEYVLMEYVLIYCLDGAESR